MIKISRLSIAILMLTTLGCSESNDSIKEVKSPSPSEAVKEVVSQSDNQTNYKEGVDYRVVSNINVGDLEPPFLVEYFWLSCGHCQKLEKPLNEFKANNPEVGFIRKHAVLGERWVMDARLYYALEETNNSQHFDEFFGLYMQGMTEEKFNQFFKKNNIDKGAFLEVAGSSESILAQLKENLKEMADNKMTSVPGIVVNGKYLITKSHGDYFDLVKYLLAKK